MTPWQNLLPRQRLACLISAGGAVGFFFWAAIFLFSDFIIGAIVFIGIAALLWRQAQATYNSGRRLYVPPQFAPAPQPVPVKVVSEPAPKPVAPPAPAPPVAEEEPSKLIIPTVYRTRDRR